MTEIEALASLLQRRTGVRLAYVFGSRAGGRARSTSDLDVAVLFAGDVDPSALDLLAEEMAEAAGRCVDLVDLANAPPLLAHQIVATGPCILSRREGERTAFETRTVLRFLDTAHLRAIQHTYLARWAQTQRDDRA